MSTSDNNSHKEEKTDLSAMKKQSAMKNEEEGQSGNSGPNQLDDSFRNLSIKESTVPPDRKDIGVKFLINVPMAVTPEMSTNAESYCQKFLDLLKSTAFREEDKFHFEDIGVVFGLNGSDRDAVETELQKEIRPICKIAFKKFGFTWSGSNDIPYRKIREEIKKHEHTKELVSTFRRKDPKATIYFCFFDADTVCFNHVLSSYIDLIKEHNPTVLSTGYVFPENNQLREKSEHDRQVRIITAKHFPLGTYYPEPNFCVRLPDEWDTLRESFESKTDDKNNMESPNLIRELKQRTDFLAVFADKEPIITPVPKKTAPHKQNQIQFHTNPRTWAISAYTHKEFEITRKCKDAYIADRSNACGIYYFALGYLESLLKSETDAQRIENGNYFEGTGANQLFMAAKAVREYLKNIKPEV